MTELEEKFNAERRLIGEGKIAKVYLWNGFAYKCFKNNYPDNYIDYELRVQNEICAAGLPAVKYYPSELPKSLKMDYIEGVTLTDRMRHENYKNGIKDLIENAEKIHTAHGIDLPPLNPFIKNAIEGLEFDSNAKAEALEYLSELPDGDTLCHIDYHFQNLMYRNGEYLIIDWISAKLGNPIYDYARTYVISYEFAYRLSGKVKKAILEQTGYSEEDFRKATLVMSLHRLSEYRSDRVTQLVGMVRRTKEN